MKPTQTGIAVALALVVVVFFFVFNGMSIFSPPAPTTDQSALQMSTTTDSTSATTTSTNPTTMPIVTGPVTQLQVTDQTVGTGATAAAGDTVTVNYVGSLTNGTVFDASANHGTSGFSFTLGAGQVIKGWDEGIVGMKVGGTRMLVIPAALAYGSQSPAPSIPANSALVFEVQLLNVQSAAQ